MDEPRKKPVTLGNMQLFDIPSAPTVPELSLIESSFPPEPRCPVPSTSMDAFLGNYPPVSTQYERNSAVYGPSRDKWSAPSAYTAPVYSSMPSMASRPSPPSPVKLPGRIKKPATTTVTSSMGNSSRRVAFESDLNLERRPPVLYEKENEFPNTAPREDESSFLRQIVAEQNRQLLALQEQVLKLLSAQEQQRAPVAAHQCGCSSKASWMVANMKQSKQTQTSFGEEETASKTLLVGDHRSVGCGTDEGESRGKEVAVVDAGKKQVVAEEEFYDNIMARVNAMLQKSGVVTKPPASPEHDESPRRKEKRKKKKKEKKHKRDRKREEMDYGRREDSVFEATMQKLREYGASFIDAEELRRGAAAAAIGVPHRQALPAGGFHQHQAAHREKKSKKKSKKSHPAPPFPWANGAGGEIDAATGRMKYMSILVNDEPGPSHGGDRRPTKERSIEISAVDMQYARKKHRHHHGHNGVNMGHFGPGFGYPPMQNFPGFPPAYNSPFRPQDPPEPSSSESSSEASSSGSESDTSSEGSDDEDGRNPLSTQDLERRYKALRDAGDDRVLNMEELRAQPKLL